MYEDDQGSKHEFGSVNSPNHGSSIKQSDLTLSQMKFNKSNRTEVKKNKIIKSLVKKVPNKVARDNEENDDIV